MIFCWKDWYWSWSSNTLATWCEELTHRKRPWCWERLRTGEGGDRGWDGWMASPTQWTWVWAKWRDSKGRGSLACCSPGDQKSQTKRSNWIKTNDMIHYFDHYYCYGYYYTYDYDSDHDSNSMNPALCWEQSRHLHIQSSQQPDERGTGVAPFYRWETWSSACSWSRKNTHLRSGRRGRGQERRRQPPLMLPCFSRRLFLSERVSSVFSW